MVSTFNFAEHVLAVSVNNEELDTDTLRKIEGMVEEKLFEFEKINFFLEVDEGMSILAAIKDLNFHIKYSKRFGKVAIVTEKELLQKFMEIKDLFLQSDIKTFEKEERISAMNWVI